jgi:hypothetical protein
MTSILRYLRRGLLSSPLLKRNNMSSPPFLNGPIPLYNNPPINPQYYQPSRFVITAITLGLTTTITTSVNHNYVVGQQVRLLIPFSFGSRTLNGVQGNVLSVPASNQVQLNINSIGVNPFINSTAVTKAQILAIGDTANGQVNATPGIQATFIPGSFINISPV